MARILIVDDDEAILRIGKKLLEAASYEVYTASDALEAIEVLNSIPMDAVLSDANMPQYSGFDLVQTIKNSSRMSHVAIAMLTGRKAKEDIAKAVKLGVDDYIIKPLDPMILLKKVEQLFKKKPPEERPRIHFHAASTKSEAWLSLKVQVESLSEEGITFTTNIDLNEGSILPIQFEILEQFGLKTVPQLKICEKNEIKKAAEWHYHASFVGATEAFLQKVRAWIYAQPFRSSEPADTSA